MSALSVRLPDSLHRAAREVAAQDGVSVNQFIASAVGEKIAAIKTAEFLKERGQGATEDDLAAVLALVPAAEPEAHDRFPRSPAKANEPQRRKGAKEKGEER